METETLTDQSTEARRELERTQMLQNLGKLTAGIAHEINTPIQFIGDNLQFLSNGFEDILSLLCEYEKFRTEATEAAVSNDQHERVLAAKVKTDVDFIAKEIPKAIAQSIDGIKRVSSMISAMRDFSHIDERRFAPANLNKAIESTIVILRNEIKYVADVETNLDDNLPAVMCCIDEIQQVFLNLVINAAHSIGDCHEEGGDRGLIKISSRIEGDDAVFTISDSGKGISPEIREKIFEQFFTTKGPGKGTGQGLSIVQKAVTERHNGRLELESAEGVGTTFTVYIPIEGKTKNE
ncbi:MAG: ATP-binding protein [Planctomycetes bacterium]|nr:ATP-binding protein [Planctomycetota bacterium]